MLKFIFFTVVFILFVRYINRLFLPSKKKQDTFRGGSRNRTNNFDEIEEAEYEDLSNKDN